MDNLNPDKETHTRAGDVKKAYHSPEFVDYGKVAKLTQSTTGPVSDGMVGGFMPSGA